MQLTTIAITTIAIVLLVVIPKVDTIQNEFFSWGSFPQADTLVIFGSLTRPAPYNSFNIWFVFSKGRRGLECVHICVGVNTLFAIDLCISLHDTGQRVTARSTRPTKAVL